MSQSDDLYRKLVSSLDVEPFDQFDIAADLAINVIDGRFANQAVQIAMGSGSSLIGSVRLTQHAGVTGLTTGSSAITLKLSRSFLSFFGSVPAENSLPTKSEQ